MVLGDGLVGEAAALTAAFLWGCGYVNVWQARKATCAAGTQYCERRVCDRLPCYHPSPSSKSPQPLALHYLYQLYRLTLAVLLLLSGAIGIGVGDTAYFWGDQHLRGS